MTIAKSSGLVLLLATAALAAYLLTSHSSHCSPYGASSVTAHLNSKGVIVQGPVATTHGCR